MVRLIDILKKSFQKRVGDAVRDSSAAGNAGQPLPLTEAAATPDGPFFRKAASATEPAGAGARAEQLAAMQSLYRELHAAVRFSLTGSIHSEKIVQLIGRVADAFQGDPYNELLLLFYTSSKNNYLPAHITNDVILTVGFAVSLGYEKKDVVDLGICAFSHDLAMGGLEAIVNKGHALTTVEIEDIKRHPLQAAELVRPVFSERIAAVVMDVHERENGQGYPRGINGNEIHVWAKIVALCDTFEALTHARSFRPAYGPFEAMKIIIKKKDVFFDELIVKRFIDFISVYPVGALVHLNSGELGLVVGSNPGIPTRPVVRIIVNEKKEVEAWPRTIDLRQQDFVYITAAVEPAKEKEVLNFLKPRGEVELDD